MIKDQDFFEVDFDSQKKQSKINLNKSERYIQTFRFLNIDASVIEIMPKKDGIPEEFFLAPNSNYLNNYEQYENEEIYIIQYPEGNSMEKSSGKISEVNPFTFEIFHEASTLHGSSGSPIYKKGTSDIIGIHKGFNKLEKKNFGYLIGPIINLIERNAKIIELFTNDGEYIGEIKNINKEGYGRFIMKNSDIYIGFFKNDKLNGPGAKNKEKCQGYFLNNKLNGKGRYYYKNGDYYIGEFKENKRQGHGKNIYKVGYYYIGEWLNDKRHFNGTFYDKLHNKIYEGEFKNNLLEGTGKMRLEGGYYYYEGDFKNNVMNGNGIIYDSKNEVKYIRSFKNNEYNGKGICYYPNDFIYEGEFLNGKKHGKGKIMHEGKIFREGDFFDDKFVGNDFISGHNFLGNFRDGKWDGFSVFDPNNNKLFEANINEGKETNIQDEKKEQNLLNLISNEKSDLNIIDKKNEVILKGKGQLKVGGPKVELDLQIKNIDTKNNSMKGNYNIIIENKGKFFFNGDIDTSNGTGEIISDKCFGILVKLKKGKKKEMV